MKPRLLLPLAAAVAVGALVFSGPGAPADRKCNNIGQVTSHAATFAWYHGDSCKAG